MENGEPPQNSFDVDLAEKIKVVRTNRQYYNHGFAVIQEQSLLTLGDG